MFRLTILACICVATLAQNYYSSGQHYNSASRPRQDNSGVNDYFQQLKDHQLQLKQHQQDVQRHLQQQHGFGGTPQSERSQHQQYTPSVYSTGQQQQQSPLSTYSVGQQQQTPSIVQHQEAQKRALIARQEQQTQAILEAQKYDQNRPVNYHPPAPVHRVNIGSQLQGDYDFTYDTGKGPLGQSFRTETRLTDGTVKGSYGYLDTDGRQRIVNYIAGKAGFVAEGDVGPEGLPSGTAPGPAPEPVSQHQQTYVPRAQQHYRPQQQHPSAGYQGNQSPAIFDTSLLSYNIGISNRN
ncbi:uncharacterized protein LOC111085254 [Limulus polyphemus]|uniref:Uncharacterized protein LOC111085254 n=1 Tax=Limulus polyphemus TaxID=6850 RepID=A0ABM1S4W0_LIMPO|nr:uncharacterized protein LOC111085254 [Limulus polyphemus]